MQDENPTSDGGASIEERLDRYLAAEGDPEPEEQDTEPQQAAEEPDVEPEDGEQEATQPQLSTTDFAKVLGIDESMLDLDPEGNAIVKTKIDGKEGTAKFADVLKSYQLQGHIDNKAREVAEQQKAMQQRMEQVEQVVQQRVTQLDGLASAAAQELTREFQSVDWQWLRENNPGEYSARWQEFQYRNQSIAQIAQAAEHERRQLDAQRDEREKATLREEAQRLPTLIPEWKNEETSAKERQAIMEWALKSGAKPERVQKMSDAFDVAAYRKAMLYDQLQTSKAAVENKVRIAPKLVKPGQSADNRQTNALRDLKQNVRKSGGKEKDLVAYLLATGKA